MLHGALTPTPELIMLDSISSSPESLFMPFEIHDPAFESRDNKPGIVDPDIENLLRVFVDDMFNDNPFSHQASHFSQPQEYAHISPDNNYPSPIAMSTPSESPGSTPRSASPRSLPDIEPNPSFHHHLVYNNHCHTVAPQPSVIWEDDDLTPTQPASVFEPLDPSSYFDFLHNNNTDHTARITNEDLETFFSQVNNLKMHVPISSCSSPSPSFPSRSGQSWTYAAPRATSRSLFP